MMKDKIFYDQYLIHSEYRITLVSYSGKPSITFIMTEDEFDFKKDMLIWLDFLIKTDQWVTYEMLHELFEMDSYTYMDFKYLKEMKIQYIESEIGIDNINL